MNFVLKLIGTLTVLFVVALIGGGVALSLVANELDTHKAVVVYTK